MNRSKVNEQAVTIKAVLLGASGSGKSSIALRYIRSDFNPYSESTIGAAFLSKTVAKPYGTTKIELWDTAGQERFESLMPMYYRNANVVFVVYDITNLESYNKAKRWVTKITKDLSVTPIFVLVGNKSDLLDARTVSRSEAARYAGQQDMLFYETSAKLDHNINNIFDDAYEEVHRRVIESPNHYIVNVNDSVQIDSRNTEGYGQYISGCFGMIPLIGHYANAKDH